MAEPRLEPRPFEGLSGLRASAELLDEVLAHTALDPLCNASTWVLPHAEAYAADGDVFGWTVHEPDGSVVAVAAFRLEPKRGALALRRAMLVQDGTGESDYLGLAALPGREEEVLDLVLDRLGERRGVDALLWTCIPDDSATLRALRAVLDRRGLDRREVAAPCIAADLPESFDAYLGSLRSRMRSKVRQALRRTEESTFAWCDDPEQLGEHTAELMRLHAERWRAAGEDGSFTLDERRRFYDAYLPAALERGELRLSRLELEGRPVAYQFGVRSGATYYQIQEGYDPALEGLRLGVALRARSVEALIEEGVGTYDFMAGDARHKRDWGGVERPCTSVAFGLGGARARVSYGARALVDRLRGGSGSQGDRAGAS